MKPFRDDTDLAAELRALRPPPRPAFAAELDERAAAGFPRRSPASDSPLSRLAARPAGAASASARPLRRCHRPRRRGGGDSRGHRQRAGAARLGCRQRIALLLGPPFRLFRHDHAAHGGGVQYEAAVPTVASAALRSPAAAPKRARAEAASSSSTGPFASKAGQRDVERSAEMVLGADPSDVGDDAAKVFETVHAYDGIVLSSSVRGGVAGNAGAEFELLIPSGKLGDALATFSGIAEVRSRHDSSDDITAPTVRLGERLRDSRATIDGLLVQLAGVDTDAERAEVEAELSAERRHAASLRSGVTKLNRRAHLSRVSLRIETGAISSSGGSSGWGIERRARRCRPHPRDRCRGRHRRPRRPRPPRPDRPLDLARQPRLDAPRSRARPRRLADVSEFPRQIRRASSDTPDRVDR